MRVTRMHITNAVTGQEMHAWRLPAHKYCEAGAWEWQQDSSALIIPFGGAWQHSRHNSFAGSGFLVLTVHTGTCLVVKLPPAEQLPARAPAAMTKHDYPGLQ